jgi:hypothetical protein
MIDNKDGHIPSPLIMFTCTVLRHALLEWQNNEGVHSKASKSKLIANRPDRSNYFNCKNDGGKSVSCCAVMDHKLLTLPGVVDTYTFLMNTWNTLLESYQQRVFITAVATAKRQIQQAENLTPAVVISVGAACVDNAILLGHLTSEVALEEPVMDSTDPNIQIDNNCKDDELYVWMSVGSGDFEAEGEESDAIPTASRRQQAATELERFDLENSDVDGYEGEDGDDEDVDEKEEASQADDGSTLNVED